MNMNVAIYSMREVKQVLALFAIFALLLSLSQGIFVSVASANVSVDLKQASNGPSDDIEDPVLWENGAINPQKGHYVEGQSMPYRLILGGLVPGTQATLIIGFDVKDNNKFAIDYMTSNDRIGETVDPCSDTAECSGVADSIIAIPAPTYTGSLNGFDATTVADSFQDILDNEGSQYVKLWNGVLDTIAYTKHANLSDASSDARVTIEFTPDSETVVLSWGGHISSSLDYPGESAVTIDGAPYHTRVALIDNGDGDTNTGKRDAQLQADAVTLPGNLTVTKYVINDNGGSLQVSNFPLFVSGTPVTSGVAGDFDAGDYTLTETGDPTYAASVWGGDCAEDGSITLAEGQMYECTITNDDIAPELTLVKEVVGGPATAADWTLKATPVQHDTTLEGTTGVTSGDTFKADTYTLSESYTGGTLPAGSEYMRTGLSCTNGVTVTNDQIALGLGATTTCTFTNTFVPAESATLHVVKNLVTDNGGTEDVSDFSFTFNGQTYTWDQGVATKTIVIAEADLGTYDVAEIENTATVTGRYAVSYSNCTSLDLSFDGAEETCTITNDDIAPKLTVVKHVVDSLADGDKDAGDFTMLVSGANADKTSFAGSESGEIVTLNANASYSVSEDDTFGYSQSSSGECSGPLDLGQTATCTITNIEPDPTTVVVNFNKILVNDNGGTAVEADFSFIVDDGSATTAVAHGGSLPLTEGDYTVTEVGPDGYAFVGYNSSFCDGGSFTVTKDMLGGPAKTCEFENDDIQPQLTVIKIVNGGKGTTSDFTLNVGSTQVTSGDTNGFDAGTYAITESYDGTLGNYTATYSGACDGTNSVDLKVGDDVTCTITNNAYTVTGFKWHDEGDLVNNLPPNGEFDSGSDGEEKLEGWVIIATPVGGGDVATTSTDSSGYYSLSLGAGEWTISEVLQGGWLQTGLIIDGATSTDKTCTFIFDEQTQDFERTCDFGNHLLRQPALSCDAFTATPNSNLAPGTEVTLEWETSDAHVVSIDNGIGFVAKDGSATTSVAADTVFTLTAQRLGDEEQVTDEVTCQVLVDIKSGGGGGGSSSPRCTAFDLNGGVLSWETRHGTGLSIAADGSEIFSTDDDDVVDEGTFELTGNRNADFELTVTRGSRSDTCIIEQNRPDGEVLGEQVSVVPLGAADTGAGGTSPLGAQLPQLLAVFGGALRVNRNGK